MGISKPGTKGIPSSLAFQGKPASGIVNKCPSKGIQLNTDKVANKIYVDSQPSILYIHMYNMGTCQVQGRSWRCLYMMHCIHNYGRGMGMKQGRRLFSGANNNIVHKTELSPQSEMLTKWKWKIVYYKILYELGREVLTIQVHKDKKFNYDN